MSAAGGGGGHYRQPGYRRRGRPRQLDRPALPGQRRVRARVQRGVHHHVDGEEVLPQGVRATVQPKPLHRSQQGSTLKY